MLSFCVLFFSIANAQVCNGTAVGKTTMVAGEMSYCDGTSWKSMKGAQGAACAPADNGKMRFQSSKFEFCNGSFWFEMKSGSAISSCTGNTGKMRWSSSRKEFCDGTSWFNTTAVASGTCTTPGFSWGDPVGPSTCSDNSGASTTGVQGDIRNVEAPSFGACGGSAQFRCNNGVWELVPGSNYCVLESC